MKAGTMDEYSIAYNSTIIQSANTQRGASSSGLNGVDEKDV
jgi:hypothetical protein